jgi:multimeric flavodoxin WrbA
LPTYIAQNITVDAWEQTGLEANGVQTELFQVEETLSDEVLTKMNAPPKPNIPVITIEQLTEPDGIIFGLPTRFGIFPAQMKA